MSNQDLSENIRLLLVEDDEESGRALQHMLQKRGVDVTLVSSAEQAFDVFGSETFSAVVADIRLAGVSGVELLRRIREKSWDFPVILLTGYESLESAIQALRLGAQDYILKPVDRIEDLLGPVTRAVQVHRLLVRNRELENELRESEGRLRILLESVQIGVIVLDAQTRRIVDANPAAIQLLGLPRASALGLDGDSLIRRADAGEGADAFAEQRGGYECILLDAGGRAVPILSTTVSVALKGRAHLVSSFIDISARKEAEEERREHGEKLRALASELLLAEEKERRRLATDVHDSIGQFLALTKLKLEGLLDDPGVAARPALVEIREFVEQAIAHARSLTFQLSPPCLYEIGLEAALEDLAVETGQLHGVDIQFLDDHQPKPLDESHKVFLFRAVRELLINTVKHARAHHAEVAITREGGEVHILVADDGEGFDPGIVLNGPVRSRGFGLFSIRERMLHHGGRIGIVSRPGGGTRITLAVPLQEC